MRDYRDGVIGELADSEHDLARNLAAVRLIATRRRPVTVEGQPGPDGSRLVDRPTATLRPHPTYQALCGPIAATRARRVAQQRGPIRAPLVTTSDGTILDGHARWQVALDRQQSSLPCLEYDVTDEEALQIVIQQHRASEGLDAFCRIVMALELEPFFKACSRRSRPETGARTLSSNLTNAERRDVRKAIASVAGVATGNVTKVKQLLNSVVPEVRERLVRGEVRIHRAWQWRTLTPKAQRDALWEHLHRRAIKTTIARLVRAHADAGTVTRLPDLPGFFGPVITGEQRRLKFVVCLRVLPGQREPAWPASALRHPSQH